MGWSRLMMLYFNIFNISKDYKSNLPQYADKCLQKDVFCASTI